MSLRRRRGEHAEMPTSTVATLRAFARRRHPLCCVEATRRCPSRRFPSTFLSLEVRRAGAQCGGRAEDACQELGLASGCAGPGGPLSPSQDLRLLPETRQLEVLSCTCALSIDAVDEVALVAHVGAVSEVTRDFPRCGCTRRARVLPSSAGEGACRSE
jgi:hypothetical protein